MNAYTINTPVNQNTAYSTPAQSTSTHEKGATRNKLSKSRNNGASVLRSAQQAQQSVHSSTGRALYDVVCILYRYQGVVFNRSQDK